MNTKPRLAVFGIGSAGLHTAHRVAMGTPVGQELDAMNLVQYIDTNPDMPGQLSLPLASTFITEGTSGGGGIRATAGAALQSQLETALARLRVAEFNILVFGAGGATGSTGGPLLANQILSAGDNVVCVILLSQTAQEASNSLEVLQRLEALATRHGRNVPALIVWRQHGQSDEECQATLAFAVSELATLFFEPHGRLDPEDLKVWMDSHRVPGLGTTPSLQALTIANEADMEEIEYADAVIALHSVKNTPTAGAKCGFFKVGQVSSPEYQTRYFALCEGGLTQAETVLGNAVAAIANARKGRGTPKRLSTGTKTGGEWSAF